MYVSAYTTVTLNTSMMFWIKFSLTGSAYSKHYNRWWSNVHTELDTCRSKKLKYIIYIDYQIEDCYK
jgi:hypothetical protein